MISSYELTLLRNLTQEKPKFYTEAIIEKGMTYEKYDIEATKSLILLYSYVATANIQGVDIETAAEYMGLILFDEILILPF